MLSTNDYRIYIANLRGIGCPEATIQDIVTGDASRAFAFKRSQLGLDGSGTGPWSKARETQLVNTLMGKSASNLKLAVREVSKPDENQNIANHPQSALAQSSSIGTFPFKQPSPAQRTAQPVYPLAFREVNLKALGFSAAQQSAIAQVRQQFVNAIGGPDQNPSDPAYLARWQSAQVRADDTLRGLLGNQAYMEYQQQKYYSWFKPQIMAAAAEGRKLEINPAAFSSTQ